MTRMSLDPLYQPSDFKRLFSESSQKGSLAPEPYRSEFRRDFARLIHSTSFRRLKGKMQLFPDSEGDYFRNRLTHSLEVAQVAKSIAIKLNHESSLFKDSPIDLDLIEFAALAHDLGHPPFGHEGEYALNTCMRKHGGFEGNAQTLRLLSVLERKVSANPGGPLVEGNKDHRRGLNLTARTLAAVLKYDREIPPGASKSQSIRKGYYASEKTLVAHIKEQVCSKRKTGKSFKTIECQIMDIADDIAYSTYDLDDALKSGLIRILDIISLDDSALTEITRKTNKAISGSIGQKVEPGDVWEALISILESQGVLDELKDRQTDESISDLALKLGALLRTEIDIGTQAYHRNQLTSHLVGEFIQAVQVRVAPKTDIIFAEIYLDKKVWIKIETLKHLAFHFLIHSPRWKVVARRAREIITYLFETLTSETGFELMPDDCKLLYQQANTSAKKHRVVCDFISCMTDTYAVEFYSRLKSDKPSSFFKPI